VILYLKRQTRKACFRTFPVRSPIDLPPQFWAGAKADMHPAMTCAASLSCIGPTGLVLSRPRRKIGIPLRGNSLLDS
jgi:hypothetical protein